MQIMGHCKNRRIIHSEMLGCTLVPIELRLEGEDFVKEEVRVVDGQLIRIYAYNGS